MTYQAAMEQGIRSTGVFRCLECGKCTAVCPVSRYDHRFSPRRTVGRALMRHDEALLADDRLWACLTCLCCSQVCPAAVAYTELTLAVRTEACKLGTATVCTHGETIHSWMRMMTNPSLKQNRLDWLTGGQTTARRRLSVTAAPQLPNNQQPITHQELHVSAESDTLFFVGCAPYFYAQFGHIGVDGINVAQATVRILNALGIAPQVLADERCCGHDLLWEGDEQGFLRLAELNAALVRQSGVRRIVTSCPECARALKVDYAAHGILLEVEVLHLAELLADADMQNLRRGTQDRLDGPRLRVTYQDPCRLGRHLGIYAAPRQVIEGLGFDLVEMPRNRENAVCCGTNGWTHCGAANRQIQGNRLHEAQSTGADVMVTACLKCQIHFRCSLQDRQLGAEIAVEIKDLATLVAEHL